MQLFTLFLLFVCTFGEVIRLDNQVLQIETNSGLLIWSNENDNCITHPCRIETVNGTINIIQNKEYRTYEIKKVTENIIMIPIADYSLMIENIYDITLLVDQLLIKKLISSNKFEINAENRCYEKIEQNSGYRIYLFENHPFINDNLIEERDLAPYPSDCTYDASTEVTECVNVEFGAEVELIFNGTVIFMSCTFRNEILLIRSVQDIVINNCVFYGASYNISAYSNIQINASNFDILALKMDSESIRTNETIIQASSTIFMQVKNNCDIFSTVFNSETIEIESTSESIDSYFKLVLINEFLCNHLNISFPTFIVTDARVYFSVNNDVFINSKSVQFAVADVISDSIGNINFNFRHSANISLIYLTWEQITSSYVFVQAFGNDSLPNTGVTIRDSNITNFIVITRTQNVQIAQSIFNSCLIGVQYVNSSDYIMSGNILSNNSSFVVLNGIMKLDDCMLTLTGENLIGSDSESKINNTIINSNSYSSKLTILSQRFLQVSDSSIDYSNIDIISFRFLIKHSNIDHSILNATAAYTYWEFNNVSHSPIDLTTNYTSISSNTKIQMINSTCNVYFPVDSVLELYSSAFDGFIESLNETISDRIHIDVIIEEPGTITTTTKNFGTNSNEFELDSIMELINTTFTIHAEKVTLTNNSSLSLQSSTLTIDCTYELSISGDFVANNTSSIEMIRSENRLINHLQNGSIIIMDDSSFTFSTQGELLFNDFIIQCSDDRANLCSITKDYSSSSNNEFIVENSNFEYVNFNILFGGIVFSDRISIISNCIFEVSLDGIGIEFSSNMNISNSLFTVDDGGISFYGFTYYLLGNTFDSMSSSTCGILLNSSIIIGENTNSFFGYSIDSYGVQIQSANVTFEQISIHGESENHTGVIITNLLTNIDNEIIPVVFYGKDINNPLRIRGISQSNDKEDIILEYNIQFYDQIDVILINSTEDGSIRLENINIQTFTARTSDFSFIAKNINAYESCSISGNFNFSITHQSFLHTNDKLIINVYRFSIRDAILQANLLDLQMTDDSLINNSTVFSNLQTNFTAPLLFLRRNVEIQSDSIQFNVNTLSGNSVSDISINSEELFFNVATKVS